MTAPSDPPEAPEFHEEEQEIVLLLGDILPRVPPHLLKPGPHDTSPQIRFSVEELAAKISRGRVSVPLQRLSSVCPEVFRDSSAFPGEQEVPLPLQKLLEQVGLVSPKTPTGNNIPGGQVARARAEAARLIDTRSASTPAPQPEQPTPKQAAPLPPKPEPVRKEEPLESNQPNAGSSIAKALSTARQFLGLFGRQSESARQEEPKVAEPQPAAVSTPPQPARESIKPAIAPVEPAPTPSATKPEPASQALPDGSISLHARPIFALLSPPILKPGPLPEDSARVAVPLALLEPQLATGHVEIPVADFINGLPSELKNSIDPIPGTLVWIPLDEVFQNLPKDHLYYMPAFDSFEPMTTPLAELPDVESPAPAPEKPADPEPIIENKVDPPAVAEETPTPPEPPAAEKTAPPVAEPVDAPTVAPDIEMPQPQVEATVAEPIVAPAVPDAPTPQETPSEPATSEAAPEPVAPEAPPIAAIPEPEPTAAEPAPVVPPPAHAVEANEPVTSEEPAPLEQPNDPTPPRAPWMRGIQVPPPRLFGKREQSAPSTPAHAETPITQPPSTPEAKRTADFLASQPGIFAAAAFVESSVFASSDFPRMPDLETLHEFMTAFVSCARNSGERLGWNRVLRMPCENFHLTAVVRDNHFLVALHHDRNLSTLVYETLISAADELSKPAA